jgi:hypothetical protein
MQRRNERHHGNLEGSIRRSYRNQQTPISKDAAYPSYRPKEVDMTNPEITFSDQQYLEELVKVLQAVGFSSPKWNYEYNVRIGQLAPCSKRKFLCDIVAYRNGVPVCVFELDGHHHVEEKQERLDAQKENILMHHGIRIWRMWNGEIFNIREDGGVCLRSHVKAHMYARHGTLASDWKKLCKCKKEA